MPLGAYSIIRYSNDLNDQRVNLGVLLWHPEDGIYNRISPSLDRAQAVDARVRVGRLKQQIAAILESAKDNTNGAITLERLSKTFTRGIEVTSPYPAEMFDVETMLDRLYESLVSSVEEFRRASSQKQFEKSVSAQLTAAVKHVVPHGNVQHKGMKRLNGVEVNLGLRVIAPNQKSSLWRAVSLQSEDRPDAQIAKAKAAALDIATIRKGFADFKNDRHYVALQPPKARAAERVNESIAWLQHEADEVLVLSSGDAVRPAIESALLKTIPRTVKR